MSALMTVLRLYWRANRPAFLTGLALMIATLVAGALLLGLSGWFITACAIAGTAGVGVGFDFFRPSAGVRLLALVRTAARYGERLTTHDATLRFLAALRLTIFRGLSARPFEALGRLRSAVALNRLTSDVDALDMVYLRLAAPLLSALAVLALAALLLSWLVHWTVAVWIVLDYLVAGAAIVATGASLGRRDARRRAYALDAVRVRMADLVAGATELAMAGRLARQRDAVSSASARVSTATGRLDGLEIGAGTVLHLAVAMATAGALVLGARAGLSAEIVAIGIFAAIGLGEILGPLQRGALESGRAILAARRIAPLLGDAGDVSGAAIGGSGGGSGCGGGGGTLSFDGVSFARSGSSRRILDGLTVSVAPGEWVALTGPSGSGKSTVLALAAGLHAPDAGQVCLAGTPVSAWPEQALRANVALLPQRSELLAGTIADNLRLAAPEASDAMLWHALETVLLDRVVAERGGLDASLGERGAGLSGGEMRRLALARIVLRRPAVVLLDEPTEGLDAETAGRVVRNLRRDLETSCVLTASHRAAEREAADRIVRLR